MAKLNSKKSKKNRKKIAKFLVLSPIVLLAIVVASYQLYFIGKIYPGVMVAGINVGGKDLSQASSLLSKKIATPEKLTLKSSSDHYEINLKEIGLNYDIDKSVRAAYDFARTGNIVFDEAKRISLLIHHETIGLRLDLNENALSNSLSVIAGEVSQEPTFPSVKLIDKQIVVDQGKKGTNLDLDKTRLIIGKKLALLDFSDTQLPIIEVDPTLSASESETLRARAEKIQNKSLSLSFEDVPGHSSQTFTLKGNGLLALLDGKSTYSDSEITKQVDTIASQIDRDPQEAVFAFENGKVTEFSPGKDGIKTDKETLAETIKESLSKLEESEDKGLAESITVAKTPPKTETSDVNNLGIKELLGRGVSRFRGSIANRAYNIAHASANFKGILVAPGEIFSFNNVLGDVSELTGYKQAFVIKDGKTVLGDGGGVCQVSTTFFRAALNAGLPIIERRAHSYRVGYYEQDSGPGLDATVYAPTTDLKVKNDTPATILIQATADLKTSTLVFEIYGTSDGRVASTSKPVVTDVKPPPDDLYVDDPTLPAGQVKQIDYKAWGAKVTFNYLVQRDGQTIYQKKFVSNYQPWQAIFLRGTAPAI